MGELSFNSRIFVKRAVLRPALAVLLALSLSACSMSVGDTTCKCSKKQPQAAAPTPAAAMQKTLKSPTPMDEFRLMAKPQGLKFTPLFAAPIDDDASRTQRLEEAVQQLRDDFDTVVNSIVRSGGAPKSAAAQEPKNIPQMNEQSRVPGPGQAPLDIKPASDVVWGNAYGNLSAAEVKVTPMTPVSAPATAAVPIEKTQKMEAGPAVTAVRIGDHADKTRLVLDVTVEKSIQSSLQNDGKRLVVDLSGLKWTGASSWEASSAALVTGWKYEAGKLYIDLLYPSAIREQRIYAPEGSNASWRAVIDLFSKDVHR